MRRRPSARLLVLSPDNRILLFWFSHDQGALAGQSFWATPGGAVKPGERFEDAAVRELREEVGPENWRISPEILHRAFEMQLPDGEMVIAEEVFFAVKTRLLEPSQAHWSPLESSVMKKHRWWSQAELAAATETVFPTDILAILRQVPGHW